MDFFDSMTDRDVLAMNALALAYVGDAVQSLYVRRKLAVANDVKAQILHKLTSEAVKASAQAALAEKVLPTFDETELSVYHRGRNSSPHHRAKNQSSADYRKATGLEAVFGYLYLTGRRDRLLQILETQL